MKTLLTLITIAALMSCGKSPTGVTSTEIIEKVPFSIAYNECVDWPDRNHIGCVYHHTLQGTPIDITLTMVMSYVRETESRYPRTPILYNNAILIHTPQSEYDIDNDGYWLIVYRIE